jgi:hypothetical protein
VSGPPAPIQWGPEARLLQINAQAEESIVDAEEWLHEPKFRTRPGAAGVHS